MTPFIERRHPFRPDRLNQGRRHTDRLHDYFSSAAHFAGTGLSIAGLCVLVINAASKSAPMHVVSFAIFGSSMVLLYAASTIYHAIPYGSIFKSFFSRLDQSMIYVLIGGSYTPIFLVAVRGGWGWSMFGVVWFLALMGIIFQFSRLIIPGIITTTSYVILGLICLIAIRPLLMALAAGGFFWLAAGGVFYLTGVIFYRLDYIRPSAGWFNWHDVFHLFILAGTSCHFVLMQSFIMKIR